ncbi:MAG TPA: asparagine synthase C-terminal domain-containing protein [Gemmatimonadales bacterium]|nr:asparagine synthase C-terminal domain-containing protein [Gemmatimonadales bacterium]
MTMFFSAYLGPIAGATRWEAAITEHARWLGCVAHVQRDHAPTASGVVRAHASLAPAAVPESGRPSVSLNAVTVAPNDSGFTVQVPLATPQPCYVLDAFGGRVLSDDLRFCASLTGGALDAVGVYALLLYGQSPAPLTLLRGVTRLAGGHEFRVDVKGMTATRDFAPTPEPTTDIAVAERRVLGVVDRIIAGMPAHSVLFFSGGVDSSLLAARAAVLGRSDVQLVNYAFGPDDPEAAHALRVAAALNLACERITHEERFGTQVLDRLGRDYAFPFGDLSTLPTNLLVHAAFAGCTTPPVAVVEGTGADGAFGLAATYGRWRAVFALPAPLRTAGTAAYDWLRLWRFNFYLERVLRFVRKSTRLGIRPAVMAQHSLDGIAFDLPRGVSADVPEPSEIASPEERLSLLDLAWVCAGRMAPKSFDPLRARGVQPIYPYLEPDMIRASSSVAWSVKSAGGEEKSLLKALTARHLPGDLVYRRKSGFTPPYRATLASAPLQEFLHDVVLVPHNPLLEWCDLPTIRGLVTRAGSGAHLSAGAIDFLWTLVFATGWLRQLPSAQSVASRSVA